MLKLSSKECSKTEDKQKMYQCAMLFFWNRGVNLAVLINAFISAH
jgi:hypothetical protein